MTILTVSSIYALGLASVSDEIFKLFGTAFRTLALGGLQFHKSQTRRVFVPAVNEILQLVAQSGMFVIAVLSMRLSPVVLVPPRACGPSVRIIHEQIKLQRSLGVKIATPAASTVMTEQRI